LRGSYDELNDRRWPRIPNASVESERKNQMLTRNVVVPKSSARVALALVVAAFPVFSQALVPPVDFGMLGLARGQTMRLSVVAVAPGPCIARIGFQNAAGANFPGNPDVRSTQGSLETPMRRSCSVPARGLLWI
jgi:hypothetical protein